MCSDKELDESQDRLKYSLEELSYYLKQVLCFIDCDDYSCEDQLASLGYFSKLVQDNIIEHDRLFKSWHGWDDATEELKKFIFRERLLPELDRS